MPTNPSASGNFPDTWKRPPLIKNSAIRYTVISLSLIYFIWVVFTLPIDWERVSDGMVRAKRIFGGAFPPNFDRSELLIKGFLESLRIAILATFMGVALSIPIAFMAAKNLAPKPVYFLGRAIIIIARSFHPIIVAIIFVKAVGFGAFAGVLTLTIYSIGFVGKLLAERIEEIDWGMVEAMKAAGSSYFSMLIYAIFPQIMPRQIGLAIYQLDSNLRASAVVGIVGAGGIGSTLANAFGRYDYDFALAITLVIIAVILVSEAISGYIRKKIK